MIKRLVLIFSVLLCSSPVFAAPQLFKSKPEPVVRLGTPLKQRFLQAQAVPGAFFAPAGYPAAVNILLLRVEFQKTADPASSYVTGSGLWLDPLYSQGTGSPTNSADLNDPSNFWVNRAKTNFINYWNEVSYGLLTVTINVSAKVYQLPHVMAHYGNETDAALQNLIYDSITTAMTDTTVPAIDFTQYDAVLIVHAGAGEESDVLGDSSNDIWSLYYTNDSISPNASPGTSCSNCLAVTLKDGKPLHEAIIMPQTDSQDGFIVDPFGVYVHEFGHWLGLPDLYCTSIFCPAIGPEGVGKWSLMGDGIYNYDANDPTTQTILPNGQTLHWYGSSPAHLDAWSKVKLGWVSPVALTVNTDLGAATLNQVENNRDIIKIPASSSTASQYFLIENRQQTGFDKGLPGHGLLVWLVDDVVVNNNYASNSINNSKTHPGIKLIEADNDWSLLTYGCIPPNDCGSAGDPFPGSKNNTALTPITQPSSDPYATSARVNIRNITETAQLITAQIGFGPSAPFAPGMSADTVTWMPNLEKDVIGYEIFKNGKYLAQTADTFFTDLSAGNGDTYMLAAVKIGDYESDYSGQVVANKGGDAGGAGSDPRCFIATAAYGSSLDPHVEMLRNFRDRVLMRTAWGRSFVAFYYRLSPPLADFISRHDDARAAARWMLTPVVYSVEYPVPFFLMLMGGVAALAALLRRPGAG